MEHKNHEYEAKDELLILYLKGLATDAQRIEARAWINENPSHANYFNALKEFYQVQNLSQSSSKFNKEEGWNRVQAGYYKELYQKEIAHKIERKPGFIARFAIPAAAALLLAFLTRTFVYSYLTKKYSLNTFVYNEIVVPLGAKSHVTLSDGTKVWLNAGSKLRYPVLFGKNNREVYLEGEGFFDVTHDKDKLFMVKTSEITIKVFGTQFNVKSYPEENKVTTTLVKGSIAIEGKDKANPDTYLKPNQTAVFFKTSLTKAAGHLSQTKAKAEPEIIQTNDLVIAPIPDPIPVTSWKDQRWVIDSEDLGQLAILLERRYNVKILFIEQGLKNYKFSGTLTDETFEQVLKIIQLSAPIQFTIDHNQVTIKEDLVYKTKYDNMITKPTK